jgi:hypothetical protein
MLNLLDRYLQLASAMVPPQSINDAHSPTLWHPDLHLNNVFVDPQSKQITHVIDRQSAAVLPFFYQCGVPTMFKHPGGPVPDDMTVWPKRPENYHSLEQAEKEKVDNLIGSEVSINITLRLRITETQDIGPRYNCRTAYERSQRGLSKACGKTVTYSSFNKH